MGYHGINPHSGLLMSPIARWLVRCVSNACSLVTVAAEEDFQHFEQTLADECGVDNEEQE